MSLSERNYIFPWNSSDFLREGNLGSSKEIIVSFRQRQSDTYNNTPTESSSIKFNKVILKKIVQKCVTKLRLEVHTEDLVKGTEPNLLSKKPGGTF